MGSASDTKPGQSFARLSLLAEVSLCYGWAPVDLQHIGVNIFWNRRVSSLSKAGVSTSSVAQGLVTKHRRVK